MINCKYENNLSKIKDIALSSYKLLNDNCKYENNLSSEELSSLKTLMRNKNIVIQKADKGNTVVIMDKEKYIQGVQNVISDSSKFIPLKIPPEDYINYIVNVEKKFRKLFKAKIKDIALSSYKLLNDNCKYENNLSSEELSSLKTLMRNKNIVIQKADKGNTVVIMDKEKYIQGVQNVISDSSKFIPLKIPPEDYINYIVNVEKKFRKLFKAKIKDIALSSYKLLNDNCKYEKKNEN